MRFVLPLLLLLLASNAQAQRWDPVAEVESYLRDAQDMLARAVDVVPPRDRSRLQTMTSKARSARVVDAAGTSRCTGVNAMRAVHNGNTIYVCPNFFNDPGMSGPNERLHAVVHELAHLAGVPGGNGECEADRLAHMVMDINRIRLSASGYALRCGGRPRR